MTATCETCRFLAGDDYGGDCRRYPPTVVTWQHPDAGVQFEWLLPRVRNIDWCGEHQPTQTAERTGG